MLADSKDGSNLRETIPGLNSTWGKFIPVEFADKVVDTYMKGD